MWEATFSASHLTKRLLLHPPNPLIPVPSPLQFTYAEDECPAPEWAAMLAAAQFISGAYPELHAELQRCR